MILLAQFEPQAAATAGQEAVVSKQQLIPSGDCFADTAEGNGAKPHRQNQAILQLCCNHVAIEVLARCVSSQFIVGSIDAVPVEGRLPACRAGIGVIGKNLFLAQTPILRKRSSVRLKGVLAAQRLGKEVGREGKKSSTNRIEPVEAGIPSQPCADRSEGRVEPNIRGKWDGATTCIDGKERMSRQKARAQKKFPPNAAQELPK